MYWYPDQGKDKHIVVHVLISVSYLSCTAFLFSHLKDDEALLQTQRKVLEDLKKHMEALSPSLAPMDLQRLQARQEECLQPFSEAKSLLQNRSEALGKLETFLVTYRSTSNSLQTLQRAVGQANWDQTKDRNLNQEVEQLSQELASMELQAISLDSYLNKVYLHLHVTDGDRTSCRALVEDLGSGLQQIQRSIGTRQSEAEALGAMWSSFTRRKELLLRSLTELEDRARQPWLPEANTQNFHRRYPYQCLLYAVACISVYPYSEARWW